MASETLTMDETQLKALDRKARAFDDLLAISRGQDEVLGQDDPEALLSLLARKKGIMQEIEAVDRELGGVRPDPADPQVETLLRRIRETLGEIVACEEETKRRVESMKRQTLEEISKIRQGRRAAELYRRLPPGGGAVDREH